MKQIIIIVFSIILFSSCNNKSKKKEDSLNVSKIDTKIDSGNHKNHYGKILDTIFFYYKNGLIKEKGCVEKLNRVGWWYFYDTSGVLISKSEFIIRNNTSFLNQKIEFKKNGEIDYSKSSCFNIENKDTIKLGKTAFKINYYSDIKNYKTKFVYIIIDNQYSQYLFKKDTFTDDISKLWFGVNAIKKGRIKINGIIEEEVSFLKNEKDSSQLTIKKYYKYFQKILYVK